MHERKLGNKQTISKNPHDNSFKTIIKLPNNTILWEPAEINKNWLQTKMLQFTLENVLSQKRKNDFS